MKKIYIATLVITFIIGIVLRLYGLGYIPNSLNWDEVSWGYNAYSILITGRDEHNVLLPLSFEAFGDFKQPVYVYLTTISIWLFGLGSFAVRFPSALLGILTIPFVWLLTFELFKKEKYRFEISLLAMLFFAISPWSIQFSRVAYEANAGLFFVIAGCALFIRGLNTKTNWYFPLSIILLSVSGYTYHSQKLFTPILFIGLLALSYLKYKLSKKFILILLGLFILGNLFWILDPRTTSRGRSVTFYSNQTQILENSTEKIIYDEGKNDYVGEVLHNRRIVYFNKYIENYLSHFNLNYLFITGDNARHHAYGMGILFLVSLPAILIGIVSCVRKKKYFIFFWLLVAPIASALAVDAPNASRSLVFLPTWQIFEAVGIVALLSLRKRNISSILVAILSMLYVANFAYYVHNYFVHTNPNYGLYWQAGYREAVIEASNYENRNVFFSKSYEQAYIFYLFYTKYDPSSYNKAEGSSRITEKCYSISNAHFGDCEAQARKGDIFITNELQKNSKLKKLRDIKLDRETVGYIYEFL